MACCKRCRQGDSGLEREQMREQEYGMEFWILLFAAFVVLVVQWAAISVIALGALRRQVQGKLRELVLPVRRYLEGVEAAAARAQGAGIDVEVIRSEAEAQRAVEGWLGRITEKSIEQVAIKEVGRALNRLRQRAENMHLAVEHSTGLVEGWIGIQSELREYWGGVEQAVFEYNEVLVGYQKRRNAGATPLVARWFGFALIPELRTGEIDKED